MTNISGAVSLGGGLEDSVFLTEKVQGGLVYIVLESKSVTALDSHRIAYLERYSPLGYATAFKPTIFNEKESTWVLMGSRFSSCD